MTNASLRRTPLHAEHVALGARMTEFGGWDMPLQYDGIIAEHMAVRERAGLFDVSHMGQLRVVGAAAIDELQRMLSNDLGRIDSPGAAQYSLLLNEHAGIEDDLIAYRLAPEELLLVVNAANRVHDAQLLDGVADDESDGWAMLALQGPLALDVVAEMCGCDLRDVPAFVFTATDIAGAACIVARTGYTGERGCEIMLPADGAVAVWRTLMRDDRVSPCGLGARDTLRLEACYPLHGSDIDASTDPIAAGLGFAAPKGLHASVDACRTSPAARRLVALRVTGAGIPRAGNEVRVAGTAVGVVTSGTMSPVLRCGIALAWVDRAVATTGTEVAIDVRGRSVAAEVVKRPFVAGS